MTQVRVVVVDADVLFNLLHVDRLRLLGSLRKHAFVVPDHVLEEVTRPEQRTVVDTAVAAGWLRVESLVQTATLDVFADLRATRLGRGEAACIGLAFEKGWSVATDDRRARCEAAARLGEERALGTPEIFVLAIRTGLLAIDEADLDKVALGERPFKMSFASFRELVGDDELSSS